MAPQQKKNRIGKKNTLQNLEYAVYLQYTTNSINLDKRSVPFTAMACQVK